MKLFSWVHDLSDSFKHVLDALAISLWLAAFITALPKIAAGLSIIWTLIRISESRRFAQLTRWWQKRKEPKPL